MKPRGPVWPLPACEPFRITVDPGFRGTLTSEQLASIPCSASGLPKGLWRLTAAGELVEVDANGEPIK